MARVEQLVKVEDIDISLEQEHARSGMKIYTADGSGQYSADGSQRLIVWIDPDDDDWEYPRQSDVWYPLGTLIPLEVHV